MYEQNAAHWALANRYELQLLFSSLFNSLKSEMKFSSGFRNCCNRDELEMISLSLKAIGIFYTEIRVKSGFKSTFKPRVWPLLDTLRVQSHLWLAYPLIRSRSYTKANYNSASEHCGAQNLSRTVFVSLNSISSPALIERSHTLKKLSKPTIFYISIIQSFWMKYSSSCR